jgi:hypothetical protein
MLRVAAIIEVVGSRDKIAEVRSLVVAVRRITGDATDRLGCSHFR